MNIDSNEWQAIGNTVYRLFTDNIGQRCNEFTVQISADREVNPAELDALAEKIVELLNKEAQS